MVDGHCLRTLHAEDNALLYSQGNLEGATAYILDTPCVHCTKKLLSKGIKHILYTREFANIGGGDEGVKFIHEIAARRGAEIRKVEMRFYATLGNMLAIAHGAGGRLQGTVVPESFLPHSSPQLDGPVPGAEGPEQYGRAEGPEVRQPASPELQRGEPADRGSNKDVPLRVERVSPFAKLPLRVYDDDAGYDLFSAEDTLLMPGARATIGTGLKFAVPRGHAGFIWDKSGIAARHGIKTLGGVLDANYRGELKVILTNLGQTPYPIRRGEKIAQLVIKPIAHPELVETRIEEATERGTGGFGSTGLL